MQIKHFALLGFGLLTLSTSVNAGKINLPVVEVQGKQYYVYEAKKNQTFFNIASEFGWNVEELMRINYKVLSPMEKGTKVYYPCDAKALSQSPSDYPDADSDLEPVSHLVKKGETVYSISRLYNIPVEKIYSLNPQSREGIKAGEILMIKEQSQLPSGEENPDFYVIKKGDTLYQLARSFNTTVAAILSNNPGISDKNFMAGATIKLPRNGEGIKAETKKVEESKVVGFSSYKVEKKDTWDSISDKTGVTVEDLKDANSTNPKLKTNHIIGIPDVVTDSVYKTIVTEDPRELTLNGVNEIYEDVHGIIPEDVKRKEIKVGIVMSEPSSRKDLDFTRGFLTGLDKLKRENYSITLKVFDGTVKPEILIDSLASFDGNMIFTTYEKNTPQFFSDYALVSQTPVVNTFDLKDEGYLTNPYIINILTPSNYFNDEIANYINSRYTNSSLIIVGSDSDSTDPLETAIAERWKEDDVFIVSSVGELSNFSFKPERTYVIFGNVSKKEEIESICDEIEKLNNEFITSSFHFIGRPNWIVYDEILREKFQKNSVMIPARFYFDKTSDEAAVFLADYKRVFNMVPVKSFPMYSTMGYDEALYFLPSIAVTGGDLNEFKPSRHSVQSDFELSRPVNWSGIVNPCVYMVKFTPLGKIEKIKIK